MVDVAGVSVVSSAAVALGSIVVTVYNAERQRSHEADLDFEKRVWDRKSAAIFTLMEECRELSDFPNTADDNRTGQAVRLSRMLDTLLDARPIVDAFASTRCSRELTALIEGLVAAGVAGGYGNDARYWWGKARAAPAHESLTFRQFAKESEEDAASGFEPDLDALRAQAKRLYGAARESVRRAKD